MLHTASWCWYNLKWHHFCGAKAWQCCPQNNGKIMNYICCYRIVLICPLLIDSVSIWLKALSLTVYIFSIIVTVSTIKSPGTILSLSQKPIPLKKHFVFLFFVIRVSDRSLKQRESKETKHFVFFNSDYTKSRRYLLVKITWWVYSENKVNTDSGWPDWAKFCHLGDLLKV